MRVEFKSSTSIMLVESIPTDVLKVRAKGVTAVRNAIAKAVQEGNREQAKYLIASMNYNVGLVNKTIKNRK